MAQTLSTETLAQVAQVLSREYGVDVRLGGSTASTMYDKEKKKWVIQIPAITHESDFYTDIIRCYIDHEAGHVRFTDMKFLQEKFLMHKMNSFIRAASNIFEDIYVERKMSRNFPGCARNLRIGAERIFGGQMEPNSNVVSNILNYLLGGCRNKAQPSECYEKMKTISALGLAIHPDVVKILDQYVTKSASCNSTQSCFDLACQLNDELKNFIENRNNNTAPRSAVEKFDTGTGESGSGDSGQPQSVQNEEELDDIPDTGNSGGSGGSGSSSQIEKTLEDMSSETTDMESLLNALSAGAGDGASSADDGDFDGFDTYDMEDLVNKILSSADDDATGGARERKSLQNRMMMHMDETARKRCKAGVLKDTRDAMKESAKLSSQLAGMLQTLVMNRGGFATRGRLDSRRLARIAVGRPDIFTSRVEKKGLNTEVIIALDNSGSMSARKSDVASKGLYSIMRALKGIPGVRSMSYAYFGSHIAVLNSFDSSIGQIQVPHYSTGGTPTGEACHFALGQFSREAKRKILIIISDGCSDDSTYFRSVLRLLNNNGVETIGIGVEDDMIVDDMGKDRAFYINDVSGLSSCLFNVMRKLLVKTC